MPWNPIPKFYEAIEEIRRQGYMKEVPLSELRKMLILKTGAIKDKTLSRYFRVMEELGLIKVRNSRIVELIDENIDKNKKK